MYWFRADPIPEVLIWGLLILCVTLGGWLIVSSLFNLEKHERALAGFGAGLVLFLWLVDWIGRWVPPYWAFVASSAIVLLLGLASRFSTAAPALDTRDWKIPLWLATGFVLGWMFLRVSIGTGMFDEYKNLALISTLANGNIPAPAYFGSPQLLRYHYGFHLLGASMMQIGNFMPWSAFDLSKAIVWALAVLLSGLVGKRLLRSPHAAAITGTVMALAGGTRYLLLLLPSSLLLGVDSVVHIANSSTDTAATLSEALAANWVVDSGPPVGYPFAFLSGVNPPYVIAHGGETTITLMVFMLALLLALRGRNLASMVLYVSLFSFWALASEASFVLFAAAWLLGWRLLRPAPPRPEMNFVSLALLISIPFVFLQGGTITAMAQKLIYTGILHDQTVFAGSGPAEGFAGFSFQWPPAIISSHLGVLPMTNLLSVLVAVLEIGPVVLFLPWLTYDWLKNNRQDGPVTLLVLIAWIGLLVSMFVNWEVERDITRITDFAVTPMNLLLLIALDRMHLSGEIQKRRPLFLSAVLSIGLMCVGGVVLAGTQLTAAQQVVLSQHYNDKDALLVKEVWGRLPRKAKMFGQVGKPSILTGQLTGGVYNYPAGDERLVWTTLERSPTLELLVQNKFDFVFVDSGWWRQLTPGSQRELEKDCISVLAQTGERDAGPFLEILDLRNCH